MTKYKFTAVTSQALIALKQAYLKSLVAPLDGMWESFAEGGQHWAIAADNNSENIGYCVLNDGGKLLQFFTIEKENSARIFKEMQGTLKPSGAFVATQEALYLSHCLDSQNALSVNALLYQEGMQVVPPSKVKLNKITKVEFEHAVDFGITVLGCDVNWLKGYYENLIVKQQLFGVWKDNALIATGECRLSDSQKPYADVGMMVAEAHRGQGLATEILRGLRHMCKARGLKAICSTESENLAAQKAIMNAGFVSEHRILEIGF